MALAKGASMAGTATCSGEGGMTPPERDLSTKWYYQIIQSRYGFNPHHLMLADGDRVLHRPGLQGRARRPPDGPEGDRAGRRDAQPAAGHRPALAGAPPRLAGPRRPLAEDPGDARGHQLRGPDPAQARRRARLRRRAHGRQVRPGRHLPRRRRGRHRRGPARRRRGDRHPADGGDPRGAPRARGRRAGGRDRPRGRGRHPQRRRRRQVPGPGRHGGGDRPFGAHGAQLQQGDPGRHRLRGHGRRPGRASATTATPAAARSASPRRTPSCASACTSRRPPTASTTSCTRSRSRCRCSRARAGRPTCTTSSPRTSRRSPPRRRRWPASRSPAPSYIPGVSEERALDEIKTMLDRYLENPIDRLPEREVVEP